MGGSTTYKILYIYRIWNKKQENFIYKLFKKKIELNLCIYKIWNTPNIKNFVKITSFISWNQKSRHSLLFQRLSSSSNPFNLEYRFE